MESEHVKGDKKVRLFFRIIVWSIGAFLCLFYCSMFFPVGGPPGGQYIMAAPHTWQAFALLAGGCTAILITTNGIDRTIRRPKKKSN
jgi:hypothetical protein